MYGRDQFFRVPVTTLQRQKKQGGWALKDVAVKCRTLLLNRMWLLSSTEGSVTAPRLKSWNLNGPLANPPNGNTIPNKLAYVKHYALDMAYMTPPGSTETHTMFKRRLYKTLHAMAKAEREIPEMRVTQKHPTVPWTRVWNTLLTAWVKSLWYTVIHELIPTNERLVAIHLRHRCNQCGKPDTLQHRLADCGEGALILNWTRARIAALLRMDPRIIPDDWPLHPIFHFWPPPPRGRQRLYG